MGGTQNMERARKVRTMPTGGRRGTMAAAAAGAGAALVGVLTCATPATSYDYSHEPDPRKTEYVIGASDVLRIHVWRNPDLSGETTVRPDGTITLPLVGDISAAGRTPGQLRAE